MSITYEFTGPDAPATFQIDATWWLAEPPWRALSAIREAGWVHDPSGPDAAMPVPNLLELVADQHPQLQAAHSWAVSHTVDAYEETHIADPWAENGVRIHAEPFTTYPYRMVFDADAAQRWLDARGPLHHLTLSDLVTPAEERDRAQRRGEVPDPGPGPHRADPADARRTDRAALTRPLVRAALENTAAGMWILGPAARQDRITRVLRWHAQNYRDQRTTVGDKVGDATDRHLQLVRDTADALGIADSVETGYRVTGPVKGAQDYTDIKVRYLWSIASGFAHGRPWAYRGLLELEDLEADVGGHGQSRMTPRDEPDLWLTVTAVHLLSELLRLRDRRAGLTMPSQPNGAPDGEFRRRR